MNTSKLDAIRDWPQPTNLKKLREFLRITGYYRIFVYKYAQLASPLTDLFKKDAFLWSAVATTTFSQLKATLMKTPMLASPNFSEALILETDASGFGVAAILSQANHPIAYFSKKMSTRMQRQSTYTREFYAITATLAKFCPYLLGHKFIIKTDQKSLKELLEQWLQTPEQQQWLPKFLGFDFVSFKMVEMPRRGGGLNWIVKNLGNL